MSEDRSYPSNRNRIPFHVRQVSMCSTGLHTKIVSSCSICDGICRSMPFVVLDANHREVCDTCADALNLPAYQVKKLYDQSVLVHEGIGSGPVVKKHWLMESVENNAGTIK